MDVIQPAETYMMQNAIVAVLPLQLKHRIHFDATMHTKHCKKTYRLVLPHSTRVHVCVLLFLVWNVCGGDVLWYEKILFTSRGKFFFASTVWYWKFFNVKSMYATGSGKRWHRVLDLYWLWIFPYYHVYGGRSGCHISLLSWFVYRYAFSIYPYSSYMENVFHNVSCSVYLTCQHIGE